jgi:hypothetical protein
MDELDRPQPESQAANDERPLFTSTDDIDPELDASQTSTADLAPRGVGITGVRGESAGLVAGVLTGDGTTVGVDNAADDDGDREDVERAGKAPGD